MISILSDSVVLENPYTSNFFLFKLLYILLPIPPETPNTKATFLVSGTICLHPAQLFLVV